ncbi:MAG: penicillin-binding transpeptidase domain-containing protein [Oscillospiraceae bacterium]
MNTNKKIIRVLIVVSLLFLSLVTYLLYFNMFKAEDVATNSYNKRQWEDEKFVKRGSIFDYDGELLAETVIDGDKRTRRYMKNNLYSHVIGYYSKVYGKSQLEMTYDAELLGKGDMSISFNEIRSGHNLNLSIDNDLQQFAYDQLKGYKGAIVAMEPSTGRVLASVSLPDFDPTTANLEASWNSLVEREDSPFLARATQGLYPPGSTYKIVTAAAAYNNGKIDEIFDDKGKFKEGNLTVDNYDKTAHGKINLKRAFEVSSNYAFCKLGYEMGPDVVRAESEKFGINKSMNFDIPVSKSENQYKSMDNLDSALMSIGQGKLLMTPLNVAMMGSAIANDGKIMQPYIVDCVKTESGSTVSKTKPAVLYNATGSACASYVKDLMVGVVKNGTGKSAQIPGMEVAGKTGTAENESGKDHSWFVGFAPANDPQICVAVVLEQDGSSGGSTAAPIAKKVMQKYLK